MQRAEYDGCKCFDQITLFNFQVTHAKVDLAVIWRVPVLTALAPTATIAGACATRLHVRPFVEAEARLDASWRQVRRPIRKAALPVERELIARHGWVWW